jgi:hypothetical protein
MDTSGGNGTQIGHGVCVADADEAEEREKGNSPFTGLRLFPLVLHLGFPPNVDDVEVVIPNPLLHTAKGSDVVKAKNVI